MRRISYKPLLAGVPLAAILITLFQSTQVESGPRFAPPHTEISCSDCHLITAEAGDDYPNLPDFSRQCRTCHAATLKQPSGLFLSFHSDSGRDCIECHSFHHLERISARGREFRFLFGNQRLRSQCSACHSRGEQLDSLSDGHRQAAELFHSDFKFFATLTVSQTCLVCHSENPSLPSDLAVPAGISMIPQFHPHGSHPLGIKLIEREGRPGNKIRTQIDSRLRLIDGRIECITCHSLSSKTAYRLVSFADRNELCRGCHLID